MTVTPKGDKPPHVVIVARAGTGKTTTLVEGLKCVRGLPTAVSPSPQQRAIWDTLALSKNEARDVAFVAFNKSIAETLKDRVPTGCSAMTMHSLGFRAVRQAIPGMTVSEDKIYDVIATVAGSTRKQIREESPVILSATRALVSKCKLNLIPIDEPEDDDEVDRVHSILSNLADHYEIHLEDEDTETDYREEVFGLVPKVLQRCRTPTLDGTIDYDDMVWLPRILDLPVACFDLLLVDESQDLNPCQQSLAYRAGRRLVFCGDDKQAIYGFAGADSDSIANLIAHLQATDRGCVSLPLTTTYRCGKRIVEEAKRFVPDFEAHASNPEGVVHRMPHSGEAYHSLIRVGDMVLCRTNAPIVRECFRFIREGVSARIQGRELGTGLKILVDRLRAADVFDLINKLNQWRTIEVAKEREKKKPSESRIIAIHDKADCIYALAEGAALVSDVIARISQVFSERKGPCVLLSSIHRAKGLEADRVFLLEPKNATVPHSLAKSEWQISQEWNLRYVAITRAIRELVLVKDPPF